MTTLLCVTCGWGLWGRHIDLANGTSTCPRCKSTRSLPPRAALAAPSPTGPVYLKPDSARFVEEQGEHGTVLVFREAPNVFFTIVTLVLSACALIAVYAAITNGDLAWIGAAAGPVLIAGLVLFCWASSTFDSSRVEVTPSDIVIETGPLCPSRTVLHRGEIRAFRALALSTTSVWRAFFGGYLVDDGSVTSASGVEIELEHGRTVAPLPPSIPTPDAASAAFLCARLNELLGAREDRDVCFNVVVPPDGIDWQERRSSDAKAIHVNSVTFVGPELVYRLSSFGGSKLPLASIRGFRPVAISNGENATTYDVEALIDRTRVALGLAVNTLREAHFAAARLNRITGDLLNAPPRTGRPYR